MKTPLTELIEELENCKEMFTKDTNIHKQIRVTYQNAIIIAHSLLREEKEAIETAYTEGFVDGYNGDPENKDYYNKTFKN